MSILARYLLKRFFLTFFVSILCFIIIFDLVNLVENIGRFVESGAQTKDIALYYAYFTPFIVVLTCPIATLLAAIFSIGLLAKTNELTAMKAAGISIYRIAGILVLGGFLIAGGLWVFGEIILPEANYRKNIIRAEKIERRRPETANVFRNQLFQGLDGRIFQFGSYMSQSLSGEDVVVQRFDGRTLKEITTMKRLQWRDSVWIAHGVVIRAIGDLESAAQPIRSSAHDSLVLSDYREQPNLFEDWFTRQDAYSMGYFKLKEFIEVSRQLGKKVTVQLVDLYNKIAFPFINVIIILIGVALASNPRRAGLGISFGLSMGISFVFFTLVKVGIEMGHNDIISPLVAAWGTNAIFLLMGLVLLIRVPK